MTAPRSAPRQLYVAWIESRIEECKAGLGRDELLDLAEEAVRRVQASPDDQIALTELVLCDAVDALLVERLSLPDFRQWQRMCRSDTSYRPPQGTDAPARAVS
jgi:hypothetical protein